MYPLTPCSPPSSSWFSLAPVIPPQPVALRRSQRLNPAPSPSPFTPPCRFKFVLGSPDTEDDSEDLGAEPKLDVDDLKNLWEVPNRLTNSALANLLLISAAFSATSELLDPRTRVGALNLPLSAADRASCNLQCVRGGGGSKMLVRDSRGAESEEGVAASVVLLPLGAKCALSQSFVPLKPKMELFKPRSRERLGGSEVRFGGLAVILDSGLLGVKLCPDEDDSADD